MDAGRQVATVSFVFTDLVGSTQLRDRVGDDRADELMRDHVALLREAVESRGGRVVKHLGDGIMAAFPAASDAVAAAIDMQRRVAEHADEDAVGLRVGVNTGEAIVDEGDYFGTPVVVAKRLCDMARGGQILASDLVTEVLGSRGGFSFNKLGPSSLKGLSGRFEISDVAWRDIRQDVPDEAPGRSGITRRMWIAAALATTLLAAALVLVTRGPEPRVAPGGPSWERVDDPGLEGTGDRQITRMAATEDTIVMTGYETEGGARAGRIWSSQDGRSWEQARLPSGSEIGPDSPLWGVVAGSRRFVAVGSSGDVDGERRALVFSSPDGLNWEQARDASGVLDGPGDQVINRVVPDGPGYVAVGYERTTDSDGAIWASSDGITWRRAEGTGPEKVFGGPGNQEIRAVSKAPGGLVAVGFDDSSGDRNAAAWVWDGKDWTRADPGNTLYGDAGDQVMTGVVAGEGRVVAVGQDIGDGKNVAAVWITEDLKTWRRLSASDLAVDVQPGVFQGVTYLDGSFYGVGALTEDRYDAAVWVSSDGSRWAPYAESEALTGDGVQMMRDLLSFKGKLFAGGWEERDDDLRPLVWVGTR
jgi:class 3 adenylate cyclase